MADMELEFCLRVSCFHKSDGFELNVALNEERSFKEGACGSSLRNSTYNLVDVILGIHLSLILTCFSLSCYIISIVTSFTRKRSCVRWRRCK